MDCALNAQPERSTVYLVGLPALTVRRAPIRVSEQEFAVRAVQGITPQLIKHLHARYAPRGLILAYNETHNVSSAHAVVSVQLTGRASAQLAPRVLTRALRAAPPAPSARLANTKI